MSKSKEDPKTVFNNVLSVVSQEVGRKIGSDLIGSYLGYYGSHRALVQYHTEPAVKNQIAERVKYINFTYPDEHGYPGVFQTLFAQGG